MMSVLNIVFIISQPPPPQYSSRAPVKDLSPHTSPHHYELIVSPDSSSLISPHTSPSIAPRNPPKPLDGPTEANTISSKSASPGFLSPGEVRVKVSCNPSH